MDLIESLASDVFRDKVRQARATSPEERLLDGARLFDQVCQVMCDGLRDRFPEASDHQIKDLLFKQIEIAKRLEQAT